MIGGEMEGGVIETMEETTAITRKVTAIIDGTTKALGGMTEIGTDLEIMIGTGEPTNRENPARGDVIDIIRRAPSE